VTDTISTPTSLPNFEGLDMNFDIIDSHHHLFDLGQVYYPWLTDHLEPNMLLGNYDAIKQNYLPADYRTDMGDLQIVKTVHVEAETDRADPVAETRWLVQSMQDEAVPSAIVAHAWLNEINSESVLAAQSEFKEVRGIRSKPITSMDAKTRDVVRAKPRSLQDPTWRNGLGLLRKYNLSWDLRVPFWHLSEAAEVCGLYPDLPIVVEHTGLPWDRSEEGLAVWRRGMKQLAAHEHVMLKISELGLMGTPWDYLDNKRVVLNSIDLFGFNRCMFATNFPVSKLRIGYVDLVKSIAHMIEDCSKTERSALFHDTANKFYKL
jgi:predicted TIM-barrel fold metal-dependent hydrolase